MESELIRLGPKRLDKPEAITEMVEEYGRSIVAWDAIGPAEDLLREALEAPRKSVEGRLEQHRKGWLTDAELTEAMADVADRKTDIEAQLAALHTKLDPTALVEPVAQIELLAGELEAVEPGTITPKDPARPQMTAGLKASSKASPHETQGSHAP